jgi:hypothetical protein
MQVLQEQLEERQRRRLRGEEQQERERQMMLKEAERLRNEEMRIKVEKQMKAKELVAEVLNHHFVFELILTLLSALFFHTATFFQRPKDRVTFAKDLEGLCGGSRALSNGSRMQCTHLAHCASGCMSWIE